MDRQEITVAVRNLVEFVLRSGDLDLRFVGVSRAVAGTKAHQRLQKSYGKNYTPEVFLKHSMYKEAFVLTVQGRADGLIIEQEEVVIDEIKTVTKNLEEIDKEYSRAHWAQVKCYGYIYALQNELENITVQLSYFHLETEGIKRFRKSFTIIQLEEFFQELVEQYLQCAKMQQVWKSKSINAIKKMDFPFPYYRKGQRKMAGAVYQTIRENKKLYVQAPTGIGKTISSLFPTVKALGEGLVDKIFYLTAKTITRSVAQEAMEKMKEYGLELKAITLTAKDKICFCKEASCNPQDCSFAKGHFDRVNEAIKDIFQSENYFTREKIEQYSKIHHVCPFEFSLDLAFWADCIICDYNYVFDPRVYLKRFFDDDTSSYCFLIDEAHNLVDRARGMFSAELTKQSFLELKKQIKSESPRLVKSLNKVNSFLVKMIKSYEIKGILVQKEEPAEFYPFLRKFLVEAEAWLLQNPAGSNHEKILALYFDTLAFLKISELYSESYVTYFSEDNKDLKIKIFCLDPSELLGYALQRGRASIFFSGTLLPLKYYCQILGGSREDYILQLESPFKRENLCLIIAHDISTKYQYREQSYQGIVKYIAGTISVKPGNYLVFFPSYQYMELVCSSFMEHFPQVKVIKQAPSMTEEEREGFLAKFQLKNKETLVGFAVLGGIFSEGIDLVADRLIGSIIVSVGLPQISLETNIIKDYFQKKNGMGFEYAYQYPGMNKVMQAAGRVIRSDLDKGIVLLIDQRFLQRSYQKLFPHEWEGSLKISSFSEVEAKITKFWRS